MVFRWCVLGIVILGLVFLKANFAQPQKFPDPFCVPWGKSFAGLNDVGRVRKSKNFPDSKIVHAKTFRIKRVNRDTFDFATKLCKIREFHIFFGKCA